MHRVLIIGDTSPVSWLRGALLAEGLLAAVVADVDGGLLQARIRPYDVVVLVGSGDRLADAVSVRALRYGTESAIVALLSEHDCGAAARAELLWAGADESIPAGADPQEVVARVLAKHRRRQASWGVHRSADETAKPADARAEFPVRTLRFADGAAELTRSEARLLQALMRDPGRPVARSVLAAHVFGARRAGANRGLDVQVCRLRKKLKSVEGGTMDIVTVPRLGYALRSRSDSTAA